MRRRASTFLRVIKQMTAVVTIAALAGIALANEQVREELAPSSNAALGAHETIADAAIVPACHVIGLRPTPILAARLQAALDLYRAGRVRRILVTGNGLAGEPTAMRLWLTKRGVPESDIQTDDDGVRTMESMRNARSSGIRSAIVCIQKLHLARALFLARSAGIEATGADVALDQSARLHWQTVEALKRTLAFAEVRVLGRLHAPAPTLNAPATTLASRSDVE